MSIHLKKIAERLNIDDLEEALYFPKYFQIETVRLCNSRCDFCAIDQWDKSVPFMSKFLFEKITEELGAYAEWVEMVNIQRAGEPLMDKRIADRIRQLKSVGIRRVCMSTNASLLNEAKAIELIDAGLDELMFSIDTINPEKYNKIRKGLDFHSVMKNIKTFFSLRDQLKPQMRLRVRGVTTFDPEAPEGKVELTKWEAFWGEMANSLDRVYMKHAHNWGNQKHGKHILDYGDVFHPCILPWSTLHVTTMGIVPLCPQDYDAKANLGNVNTKTIGEIWQGQEWNRIRKLHALGLRNQISFCKGCRLFDLDHSLEKVDL